jgi:malate dehydrogenase (oxaloacetate-decarboxylating)
MGKRKNLCRCFASKIFLLPLLVWLTVVPLIFCRIAECNNALIYPGLGFGAVLAKAKEITDQMIIAGAHRLAELSPAIHAQKESQGRTWNGEPLLPDFGEAPKVNFEIGVAVAEQAIREGNSGVAGLKVEDVREKAKEKVWVPLYADYEYDPKGMV